MPHTLKTVVKFECLCGKSHPMDVDHKDPRRVTELPHGAYAFQFFDYIEDIVEHDGKPVRCVSDGPVAKSKLYILRGAVVGINDILSVEDHIRDAILDICAKYGRDAKCILAYMPRAPRDRLGAAVSGLLRSVLSSIMGAGITDVTSTSPVAVILYDDPNTLEILETVDLSTVAASADNDDEEDLDDEGDSDPEMSPEAPDDQSEAATRPETSQVSA